MPLIIHPSSCCDVCLEPLTYDEPRPPYAIPCGHIFCQECLHTMHPSICPLCRKAFIPDRSKKLITGELETEDTEDEGLDLLQKLVVSWDRETTDEERISLVTDVDRWLGAGNEHAPLAKAHEVIRAYHSLKAERHGNHRSIIQLRQQLEQQNLSRLAEKDQMKAVQDRLVSQIQKLESKIIRHEGEREAYRRGASRNALRNNPLPRPPQPAEYDISTRYTNTNGDLPDGTSFMLASYEDLPASQPSSISSDRATPNIPSSSSSSSRTYQSHDESGGPKHTIIPGASPNQRFVPRSILDDPPPWISDSNGDRLDASVTVDVDPYAMVGEYMNEFVDGYVEGYQLGTSLPRPAASASSARRPRASRSSTGPAAASFILDTPTRPRGSSRPSGSRTLTLGDFMRPAQAGGDATSGSRDGSSGRRRPSRLEELILDDTPSPVSSPSASAQPGSNDRPSNRSRPQRRLSDMTNMTQPPDGQPQAASPSASSLRRRSAFSANIPQPVFVDHSTPASTLSDIDSLANVVMPSTSAPQTPAVSISSWGTVNTANPAPPETQPMGESARFIPTNNIVSVRDLRLRSFEDVDGGDNMSMLSDMTLGDGHDGSHSVNVHDGAFVETPRNMIHTLSLSETASPVRPTSETSRAFERHRDHHGGTYQVPEYTYPPTPAASVSSRHSHSNSTSSSSRYRASWPRQSTPAASAVSPATPSFRTALLPGGWPTEQSTSAVPPNALGLSESFLPEEPHISAPTPRAVFSARPFLNSFNSHS